MSFYLLLGLGWVGIALAAAVLMGRFIAAGRGDLGWKDEHAASAGERAMANGARRGATVTRIGKREAA